MYRARIAQYEQCLLIGLDNKEKRETNVFQGEGRNTSWLWPVKINVFDLNEIITKVLAYHHQEKNNLILSNP